PSTRQCYILTVLRLAADASIQSCDRTNLFFFNDTETTEIYPLSLHDALPISLSKRAPSRRRGQPGRRSGVIPRPRSCGERSEEHTSELQSLTNLVCRLLL